MSAKKSFSAAKTPKKAAARPVATHPSWIEMIKECIAANPEDARLGVSRPHIKKYVEEQYNLQIGNAQNTQLARAIATGAEKGIFVLPKGPAGKVKLPPRNAKPVDMSASKENKPAPKPIARKIVPSKVRLARAGSTRATTVRGTSTKRMVAKARTAAAVKTTSLKKVAEKKTEATKAPKGTATKSVAAKGPKKVLAGRKVAPAKKTTTSSKRGSAKKAVTGISTPVRARTTVTAKKVSSSRRAPVARTPSKRSSARAST